MLYNKERPYSYSIQINDVLLLCFCIMVCINRNSQIDFSSLWKYGFVCAAFIAAQTLPKKSYVLALGGIILWGAIESLIGWSQYLNLLESNHQSFKLTGTFQNPGPLGGLLGIACALTFCLTCELKGKRKFLLGLLTLFITSALLLSCSRAGWTAGIVGSLFYFGWKYPHLRKRKVIIVGSGLLLGLFIISIYLLNASSANGRLFIWYNSLRIWLDNPWFGAGTDGWLSKYMLYQANFFAQHSNSPFALWADNVSYTYNEFIHILTSNGIVGTILFGWILYETFSWKRNFQEIIFYKVALVSFLTFSFFSYPFDVIRLQILFAILLGLLRSRSIATIHISSFFNYGLMFLLLNLIVLSIISLYINKEAWNKWELYPYFKSNPIIMDAYAQKKASQIKPKDIPFYEMVASLYPTSELYTHIGEAYEKNNCYRQAESYYQTAMHMTPSKVTPLYKLFLLYRSKQDFLSATQTALAFLQHPVKVQGTKYLRMKGEIKRYLSCPKVQKQASCHR